MTNIGYLIKLNSSISRNAMSKNKKSQVWSLLGSILLSSIFAVLCVLFFSVFGSVEDRSNYLSFVLVIVQIILLFYSSSLIIKNVYLCTDKQLLSFLPISKLEIYIAKIINCIKKIFLLSLIVSIPIFVAFGLAFASSISYIPYCLIAVLLLPFLPIGVALIIAVPIMYVRIWLKPQNWLSLIISIALTVVGFYVYSKIIFNIADIMLLEYKKSNILIEVANKFASDKIVSAWLANFVFSSDVLRNLGLIVLVSIVTPIVGVALGGLTFNDYFKKSTILNTYSRTIKTVTKKRSAFNSYFVKETKEIFRNSNYLFTYFGMAVAMPIMVWICNSFMVEFAVEKLGSQIIFGTTLLVVLVFIAMICSPSAIFISKEGNSLWMLKTSPRGIAIPLFAKSLFAVISSSFALISTLIVLIAFKYTTILEGLMILAIAYVFMLAIISTGLFINLNNSDVSKLNATNNGNMMILMTLGFILGVAIGIFAMIESIKRSLVVAFVGSIAISILILGISLAMLLPNYKKLYFKMEV